MDGAAKGRDGAGGNKGVSPPTLNYGRRLPRSKAGDPEQERRFLLWFFGVMLATWVAWCVAMFLERAPAIDQPFPLAFASPVLGVIWFVVGSHFVTLMRRNPLERRYRFRVLIVVCFFLAPYTMVRAGGDVFALSLRYHLWRAGGADRVRAEFNQWVAARAAAGSEWLFLDAPPGGGGSLVPVPASSLPPAVRYVHEHFYSRFGGMVWNGVAQLDDVNALTFSVIEIGPPGWEPDGGGVVEFIFGGRRKIADGIWLRVETYSK